LTGLQDRPFPGNSVFLLNDTSVTGHFGCIQVVEAIRRNLATRGIELSGHWPVGVDWRFAAAFHPGLRNASAFIVNGEGTIHHTRERPRGRLLLQFARTVKRRSDKPVFLINASCEALEPRDFDEMAFFDRIFVRDRQSQAYLAENGIASSWVPDLCLAAETQVYPRLDRIVCTDSVVRPLNPLLERSSAMLQATFAPMRPGRWRSYWHYAFPDRAELATSSQSYYETIASARSVIAARFHAMIFCLLAGTPFLAVSSNTTKIESVLADVFGSSSRMIPVAQLANMSRLSIPAFTGCEEEQRLHYLVAARARINQMFDDIAAAIFASTAATSASASTGRTPITEFRSTT
jgi:polysaccharide pyruvyl transferase WcaK-like protein